MAPPALRPILGLLLAGYGLLVLIQVLPHDAPLAGALSLAVGVALLWRGLPALTRDLPAVAPARSRLVAGLGAFIVIGLVAYNAFRHSGLGPVEWGILAYGLVLVGAAPYLNRTLGRTDVGTLVGWSFPLVLAPLSLFAVNGALSSPTAGTAATPFVATFIVAPTAWALRLLGTPVQLLGNNLLLATPRGGLTLGVGLVCAGLYPIVLFAGLIGLHAWQNKMQPKVLAACLLMGIAGLWLMNIVRLVILAKVGIAWGPAALQQAHAHMGWILFALFMALFWFVVLRKFETSQAPPAA